MDELVSLSCEREGFSSSCGKFFLVRVFEEVQLVRVSVTVVVTTAFIGLKFRMEFLILRLVLFELIFDES